jgi:hypothetical protein
MRIATLPVIGCETNAIWVSRTTKSPDAAKAQSPLAGFDHAHAPCGAARLQALVGLFLLLGGDDGLTCVATFPDPGPRDESRAAPAALLGHRLLERENTRLFRQ